MKFLILISIFLLTNAENDQIGTLNSRLIKDQRYSPQMQYAYPQQNLPQYNKNVLTQNNYQPVPAQQYYQNFIHHQPVLQSIPQHSMLNQPILSQSIIQSSLLPQQILTSPIIQPALMQPVQQMQNMILPQNVPLINVPNTFQMQNLYNDQASLNTLNNRQLKLMQPQASKKRHFKLQRSKTCGISRPQISKFVANGEPSDDHEWPWNIQLTIGSDLENNEIETYCGGSIISKNYILTASHCFDEIKEEDRADFTHIHIKGINLDTKSKKKSNKIIIKAKRVILHPDYSPAMTEEEAKKKNKIAGPRNDIALIYFKIDDPSLEKKIVPICLPIEGYELNINTKCKVMGYGFMNARDEERFHMPTILQMADVFISSNQQCRDEVDSENIKSKITSDTVCIRGLKHPCIGDSGGPLLCVGKSNKQIEGDKEKDDLDEYGDYSENEYQGHLDKSKQADEKQWYLMGVTSFAVSGNVHDRCGHFKSAVFTKVGNYIKWINKYVNNI